MESELMLTSSSHPTVHLVWEKESDSLMKNVGWGRGTAQGHG